MDKKVIRYAKAAVVLALFICIAVIGADAQELPPSPPGDAFDGGGGGGGGGSYTPPAYQTYTKPLKSSDGTVIGHFKGQNFNSVLARAEVNGTVGNTTYALTVEGELSTQPPDDCWLDIAFMAPGPTGLPPGMENGLVFAVVNVTREPDSWSWKSGSPEYTLKISGQGMSAGSDATYYVVRSSGPDYQIQRVDVDASGSQATITFNPPGDTGLFTLMVPALPAPTPTPTPVPTPTATPLPAGDSTGSYPIYIALFVIGAIAGAAIIYIFTKSKN